MGIVLGVAVGIDRYRRFFTLFFSVFRWFLGWCCCFCLSGLGFYIYEGLLFRMMLIGFFLYFKFRVTIRFYVSEFGREFLY